MLVSANLSNNSRTFVFTSYLTVESPVVSMDELQRGHYAVVLKSSMSRLISKPAISTCCRNKL